MENEIGVGGTAVVYRAVDVSRGEPVALKRLQTPRQDHAIQRFEREYLTLRNLAHPRIVAAYDYGIDDDGPFYTMELLDGGDLQALSPMDWRRACALTRDICSALSLLHSRRLLYRDLSPRNVRCMADGAAKLIDFGAMTPVGPSREIVGTPPCLAPEALYSQPLDPRTDLYALGATLYFALTGRHAYPTRELAKLPELWTTKPVAPSALVPDIPPALDGLVLDLLHDEPAVRPASAAEVIERLCAIADLPPNEQLSASRAYLISPTLVGRSHTIGLLRSTIARSQRGSGGSVVIQGPSGAGRSRMLDASVLEAKLAGLNVLRADASDARDGPFGVTRALARQLFAAAPEAASEAAEQDAAILGQLFPEHLRSPGAAPEAAMDAQSSIARLQQALRRWLVAIAKKKALLIAIDDLHLIDEQSGALLSLLSTELAQTAIVIAATLDLDAEVSPGRQIIVKVLSEASVPCLIEGLATKETEELLSLVFGDVPNLGFVAQRLHAITSGRPRDLMRLAQHLVDRGAVQYRNGTWSLPRQVEPADLPDSLTQALQARVHALSLDARSLAQTIARGADLRLDFEECLLLTEHGEMARLLRSLDELVAAEILQRNGPYYALAEAGWTAVLKDELGHEQERRAHLRLAAACELRKDEFRSAWHLMLGGAEERGLTTFVEYARASQTATASNPAAYYSLLQSLPAYWPDCYELGLRLCRKYNRPRLDAHHIRNRLSGLVTINFVDRSSVDELVSLVEQLAEDSGLRIYDTLGHIENSADRLKVTLAKARDRYETTPEIERGLEPMAALRELGRVVTEVLGQIALSNDYALWQRLPSLSAFAPLSSVFSVIDLLTQGMGARLSGRAERAIEIYRLVLDRIGDPSTGLPPSHRLYTRLRVVGSIGIQEAVMGLPLKETWAAELATHPIYEKNGLLLRMLHHLWQGERHEAERFRRDAELMRLQNNSHQVFDSQQLMAELLAYVLAEDLTHVKRTIDALQPMERSHKGWAAACRYARGEYHRIRGDHNAALRELDAALDFMQPCCHVLWAPACGAYARTLGALGRVTEARTYAETNLALAEKNELGFMDAHIRVALALTLSKLGEHDGAVAAADAVIQRFTAAGTRGLNLAAAYEARAIVASTAGDTAGFEHFAGLCRSQLPRGSRFLQKGTYASGVRGAGSSKVQDTTTSREAGYLSRVDSEIRQCAVPLDRARRAIEVMVEFSGAAGGLLYLRGNDGIDRAASTGKLAQTNVAIAVVSRYFERACGSVATFVATETSRLSQIATSATLFETLGAHHYVPVLLSHRDERGLAVTGLALFVLEPGISFEWPDRLATQLSRCFAGAGDATAKHL